MKLVEELEVKDTSRGYLPPYRPFVIAHTSFDNDCTLLDVTIGVQNSQGLWNIGEVVFKWQEDWCIVSTNNREVDFCAWGEPKWGYGQIRQFFWSFYELKTSIKPHYGAHGWVLTCMYI